MQAKKRVWTSPFYTRFKKHKCPNCGAILDIIELKKIVNSESKDAEHFDFRNVDTFLIGDVEFTWDEFKCKNCGFQSTISNMKNIERMMKNGEKNSD